APAYVFQGTVYNEGTLLVQDSRITSNVVDVLAFSIAGDGGGGGIWNEAGTLTVTNSTIADNRAPGRGVVPGYSYGGGISNFGGSVTLIGSTLTGNSASTGGGIYSSGPLTITASVISGNTARLGDGGGIVASGSGPIAITGSTISDNLADYFGDG